jgi:hypothetical protein
MNVFCGTDYHSPSGAKRVCMNFIVPDKGSRKLIQNQNQLYRIICMKLIPNKAVIEGGGLDLKEYINPD